MVFPKKLQRRVAALWFALLLCVAAWLPAIAPASTRGAAAENSATQPRVVGYLPNWSYQAYRDIDFTALTHLNIAFCNGDAAGNLTSGIPDGDLRAIVEKAHANNVKVLAALGGGGYCDGYRTLIAGAAAIDALNGKIVAFCEEYGLDGVDLDIELASGDGIWANYGDWIAALRPLCDERGWLLSTATAQWVAGSVSAETFALFDYLNVMAYDNDSSGSTSHSSYEFAVECLRYFHTQKGVPKEKLVLGVPFYGRGYSANGSLDWNSYLSFGELVAIDAGNFNADNYNGVAYTGADTMREKCALAKDYGGIMIWEITLDAEGEYSLLGVIKEELHAAATAPEEGTEESGKDDGGKSEDFWLWVVLVSVAVVLVVVFAAIIAACAKKRNSRS